MSNKDPLVSTLEQITGALAQLAQQQSQTATVLEKVAQKVNFAQGTQPVDDVSSTQTGQMPLPRRGPGRPKGSGRKATRTAAQTQTAIPVVVQETSPQAKILDLRGRIQAALTRESLDIQKLSKVVGESVERLNDVMRDLRAESRVYNVGLCESPQWTWRVGDDTDPGTLRATIRRLISERPMTTRELADATGARMSRVGGQLVELQRKEKIVDLSPHTHTSRYLLVGDNLRDVSLAPKTVKPGAKKPSKK